MRSYIPINERVDHPEFTARTLIDMGGMGAIIDVEEAQTGRSVALKVMHPDVMAVEEARERFYLEAKVMARLEHPNIVPLHVLKSDREGRPFYTMKKVEGQSLQQIISRLRRGDEETVARFPLDRLVTAFYKVCDAIAFAHSKGVVHRDLKPANIMVGDFGEVMVMDWGLAKLLGKEEQEVTRVNLDLDETEAQDGMEVGALTISAAAGALTREGAVMGTPQYMAPEQATGRIADIDERSDVFALGGILYAILTLHPPFHGDDVRMILSKVVRGEVEPVKIFGKPESVNRVFPLTRADFELVHCPSGSIPTGLSAVAMRALSPAAEKRYRDVPALQADVELWRTGYPTSAEKATLFRQLGLLVYRNVIPSLAVLMVIVLAVWFGVKVDRSRQTMDAALVEVRQRVPMYEAEANALVAQLKFEAAIDRYDQCLILTDEAMIRKRAGYHEQKGNLYQTLARYDESIASYQESLALRPNQTDVDRNIKRSEELRRIPANDALKVKPALERMQRFLEGQSRYSELNALKARLRELEGRATEGVEDLKRLMADQGAPPQVADRLKRSGSRLVLNLSGLELKDLSFVRGTEINELHLRGTSLATPLNLYGLPLVVLQLDGFDLEDLSALKNLTSLRELHLAGTKIKDVTQLTRKRLEILDLSDTEVADLTPLAKAPLVELNVSRCAELNSLQPVLKPSLKRLFASQTPGLRIEELSGLKLEVLDVSANRISRIDALRGMPLKELILTATTVSDVTNLIGMPLTKLHLSGTPVVDLKPLASMPLEELRLRKMGLQDLSALAGLPLKEIDLTGSTLITDMEALADCINLERLAFSEPPFKTKINLNDIRKLAHLRKITRDFPRFGSDWEKITSDDVRAFWKWYDLGWGRVKRD